MRTGAGVEALLWGQRDVMAVGQGLWENPIEARVLPQAPDSTKGGCYTNDFLKAALRAAFKKSLGS